MTIYEFWDKIKYEIFRYHFCELCGKFLLRKSQFCKRCEKKTENWTEQDWRSYYSNGFDYIRDIEERNPNYIKEAGA
jgi:predicted amidophosphoribosyltransferase